MNRLISTFRVCLPLLFVAIVPTSGCSTEGAVVGGVVGATVLGARAPGHDLEQIYYLGVFDPLDQLPPTIYRVTVRGQSSVLNSTNFASGWLPAPFVDALDTSIKWDENAGVARVLPSDANVTPKPTAPGSKGEGRDPAQGDAQGFPVGRRLVLFGPEGFREAPKNHRLVIVMASDPSAYFDQVARAMGDRAAAVQAGSTTNQRADIAEFLLSLSRERDSIRALEAQSDDAYGKGGA